MPLEPFLAPILPTLPPFPETIDDWDAYRAQRNTDMNSLAEQVMDPGPDVKERRTIQVPVSDGEIDVNVYLPEGDGPHPAHLYLHGGGWVEGDIHSEPIDILCRERCVGATCVVVAVNYRKAPQHKFPVPLDDCYAALLWLVRHADELGIRTDLITVGGASAGANLAAAVALKARDEHGPDLALQLLEVPALDLRTGNGSPSREANATGYGLTIDTMRKVAHYYLPCDEDATHPLASPLLAPDLSGLPPAHILSAEYDPLLDDGEHYAERLHKAGVPVTYVIAEGHIHGSHSFTKAMASARAHSDDLTAVLRDTHARATPPS